jgi:uncharacterized protein (TIGR02421 family)
MNGNTQKFNRELRELDSTVVQGCKDIKVLSALNWHPSIGHTFIEQWERGNKILPQVSYSQTRHPSPDFFELSKILKSSSLPLDHPALLFLMRTLESYQTAAEMVGAIGTNRFTELSIQLYGSPTESTIYGMSHLEAAKLFLQQTDAFQASGHLADESLCILPAIVQEELQERANSKFIAHPIRVDIDDNLASKAAAGAKRVRIRGHSCFSKAELVQLSEHEIFVHSLTAINGREQPVLKSLGLNAPRTTRTQEGLAIFAELITRSMDLLRLRRIAARVVAVAMAIQGADFIEVFQYFLSQGQSTKEAYQSSYRVFRGGDVRGGIAFTKDATYLAGFAEVHTFLRKSIQERKLDYPTYLFAGRLTLADVIELGSCFEDGSLGNPIYLPDWMLDRPALNASLLYSTFLNTINLSSITLESFKRSSKN